MKLGSKVAVIAITVVIWLLYMIIAFNPVTLQAPAILAVMLIGMGTIVYITTIKKY